MKKLFYLSLLMLSFGFVNSANAQVSVNINIGNQPLWGPAGYDYVRYYYMPEINVYYNVVDRQYTYMKGNKWVTKSKLPREYQRFDLYRTYKVVINDRNPWNNHRHNRNVYRGYASNHSQIVIRDARKGNNRPNDHRSDRRGENSKGSNGKHMAKHHDGDKSDRKRSR